MTMKWFVVVLLINLLIVVIYCIGNLVRKKKNRGFEVKAAVMLLCPVAGACYFFFGYLFYFVLFSAQVDLEDVIFSKERVKTYMKADENRGRNMVPLEEAIAVTDKDNLREYMMNVVKGDIQKSLASIALALNSEDSETSHYAASVLQDVLNNFRANVQKNYYQIVNEEDNENKLVLCGMILEYMNEVLRQNVFSEMEQKSFVADMDRICEIMYAIRPDSMSSMQFEAVSMRCLDTKEFENCEKWCLRAEEIYPNTLSSYTCSLKYYFSREDKENFFRTLRNLRKSDVVIDRETLDLIRVFM